MARCRALLACVAAIVAGASEAVPVFRAAGATYYEVGEAIGRQARGRIGAWLSSEEMQGLRNFTTNTSAGAAYYAALKDVNAAAFPEYVEEMRGLADGAGVALDWIWTANLISELEGFHQLDIRGRGGADGHCSDMHVGNVAHGHNEDWSDAVRELWYFVEIALPDHTCTGFAYPGVLLGFAALWGERVYATQNSLYPKKVGVGLAAGFMQRRGVCGAGQRTAGDTLTALAAGRWALGASVNIIEIAGGGMASFEAHEETHAAHAVPRGGNWTHFNRYKLPPMVGIDIPEQLPSSIHRQARADELPAPQTEADILCFLADTNDTALPVYRPNTLATLVFNAAAREIRVWVNQPATHGPAQYRWRL